MNNTHIYIFICMLNTFVYENKVIGLHSSLWEDAHPLSKCRTELSVQDFSMCPQRKKLWTDTYLGMWIYSDFIKQQVFANANDSSLKSGSLLTLVIISSYKWRYHSFYDKSWFEK